MTDEELARRVAAIHAEARQLVPEWEPWMTPARGYAGLGRGWATRAERKDAERPGWSDEPERDLYEKKRRQVQARRRYLARMADPEAYEAFLAKARADQAVRDAAKRAGKHESTSGL